jgi:hypothetical protein
VSRYEVPDLAAMVIGALAEQGHRGPGPHPAARSCLLVGPLDDLARRIATVPGVPARATAGPPPHRHDPLPIRPSVRGLAGPHPLNKLQRLARSGSGRSRRWGTSTFVVSWSPA